MAPGLLLDRNYPTFYIATIPLFISQLSHFLYRNYPTFWIATCQLSGS